MFWTDCLCFGCSAPRLFRGLVIPPFCFDSCRIVASSLGVQTYRVKYDWTLIPRVLCHFVAGLLVYEFLRWPSIPIFRGFSYCFDVMFSDSSPFFRCGRFMDPVFASFTLVMLVAITLCPLLFDMCVYLLFTRGPSSQISGLDFSSFSKASTVARCAPTVALSSLFSSFPCASVSTCVVCLGALFFFCVSCLMLDSFFVSELLSNAFCHRSTYHCHGICLSLKFCFF